jgi:hypothetical protein
VAAGGGSVAGWLDGQVGRMRLRARDRPRHTAFSNRFGRSRSRGAQHDIVRDPLPDSGNSDIVHARLLLHAISPRSASWRSRSGHALRSRGGWLVCEEFDSLSIAGPTRRATRTNAH